MKKLVLRELADRECTVFLFGSRVSGDFRWAADFDIGIKGLDKRTFTEVKHSILEQIEESLIPWKVDIINFEQVDSEFEQTALQESEVWKSA
ncbi:MAG: nucleotidyltransferase domain-containing protein [Spirochaetales bacterium]|nr:nucleotidyltransferase domain-containing protein [Spirochaetales bacterium]MCF7937733.1 nucleotidyltransferase domain-containing protein [Spirochaetales bacterium]